MSATRLRSPAAQWPYVCSQILDSGLSARQPPYCLPSAHTFVFFGTSGRVESGMSGMLTGGAFGALGAGRWGSWCSGRR